MTNQPEFKSTSEAWQKYFGETAAVGLDHPNAQRFWEEINNQCLAEDAAKAIPSPLPVSEWNIFDCGVAEDENLQIEKHGEMPYVFIDFARHENLPTEYFDCSLERAFEALADSSYDLAISKEGTPVVHWQTDFYDAASPDNCRTEYYTETLLTWLKDQFLYDYEKTARDILKYYSTQPDFQNYLSNF